jgi:hypothetical protein
MKQIETERPADLARALDLGAYASPRRVKRWLDGKNEPDYMATIALLELTGMLREPRQSHSRRPVRQRAEGLRRLAVEVRRRLEQADQT